MLQVETIRPPREREMNEVDDPQTREDDGVDRGRDVLGRCRFPVGDAPRKRALPVPSNGSKLPVMVDAVIDLRVSTKEQTRESASARSGVTSSH